jgi:hypothetical protein
MSLRNAFVVSLGLAACLVHAATAQQPRPETAPNRRIEGDWVRRDTVGGGSFGGIAAGYTQATLTAEAIAQRDGARGAAPPAPRGPAYTQTARNAPGQPYIVSTRPCGGGPVAGNGANMINPDSGGFHLIEDKDEVIMAGERGGSRRIFVDGRKHPDPSRWTPSGAGHSIGHYEGEVLVVDTVGFSPGTTWAGGIRGPETRLTERFQVAPDGKSLTVTYTWDDPKIFQKPHTYQHVYDRVPPVSYAFDEWCDASDPVEQQGIVPPVQLPQ